jgi:predicted permease
MSSFMKDLRYAARGLQKSPAFALTAIATIALGIGATTAIFSVVNAVLLRPLPYADQERLTILWGDMRKRNVTDFPFPPGDFHDLRHEATLFQGLAAVVTGRQAMSGDRGDPEQVRTAGVTPNFFALLGARVVVGRDFVESDGTPQPPPPQVPPGAQAAPQPPPIPAMVILSHEFWQRRFGGERSVIGTTIDVGGGRSEIVGVLEPGFEILYPPGTDIERTPDIYAALRVNYEAGSRINVFLRVIGRLKPGVTIQQAQTQVDGIAAELRRRFPIKEAAGVHFRVESMHDDLVQDVRRGILTLMGAVTFVLLIACANVANLLLVRAGARGRELAVRAALGGTRWLLVRQMLAESVLIAAFGSALGILLAQFGIDLLVALKPDNLPRLESIGINAVVLAFTLGAASLAAVVFGVVPAIRASRPDIMEVLRSSGRTAALGGGRFLRNAVVTAEVALSFVLLIGCGLMVRSFVELQRVDLRYDPNNVLTFQIDNVQLRTPDERAAFGRDLRARLLALPGVTAVTGASSLPLDGQIANVRWGTEAAVADPSKFQQANTSIALPGYIETLRMRLVEGRTFTDADNTPDMRGVIIDRVLAAAAFPNERAVGKRLYVRSRGDQPEWLDVIGVVEHPRFSEIAADGRGMMFFVDGFFGHGATPRWAVRTTGNPAALTPQVRATLRDLNPRLILAEVQPMTAYVDRAQAPTRFALVLITIFGAIAVVLAAVGLYGVLSTAVRQRTAEIGIRMAFGAPNRSIFQLIVGHGLRLSAIGIAVGLFAAFGLTRVMDTMLVGVKPSDPSTYAAIAALFVLIAAVASWLPARRAAALDPTVALRDE